MDQPPRAAAPPDLAPGQPPGRQSFAPMSQQGDDVSPRGGRKISIPGILLTLALLGSVGFIVYVVLQIEDNQIPLMASGFVALGVTLALIALWCLNGIWRAASRARGGRAFVLAMIGGLAGMGAIGSFAVAAVSLMLTTS
ncbi:MAG TPA: hypothetical protein VFP56_08335 [Candidatus Limnocylindrales bacterium]|nr:hypothetical protein [Candidatus Limnocylindrales bacterium]